MSGADTPFPPAGSGDPVDPAAGGRPREPRIPTGPPTAQLARITPVQAQSPPAPDELQRLSEVVSQTRRQLASLYQSVQSQRGEGADEMIEELRQLKVRLTYVEQKVAAPPAPELSSPSPRRSASYPAAVALPQNPMLAAGQAHAEHKPQKIDRFLRLMVERGASDLHLSVGCAPMFRESGDIEPLRYRPLTQEDWSRLLEPITPPALWTTYEATGDGDFAYQIPGLGRFRVNIFRQERGGGSVFRVIPTKILTIDQLALPEQAHRIARITGGLVLVTGPTGSGKSTTLAAILNEINRSRAEHIITLEDPIEFVHESQKSLVNQREVGTHSTSFGRGLRDAVREDPNLLLVGEMRDMETIRLALESAEKGLLVFGTLHTNNAAKTVDRIINTFPADEQETIRSVLADTVRAILAQQLLKRVGGGRVAAVEILFGSPALSNLIREGKSHQITSLIQTGSKQGMIGMDDSLRVLLEKDWISREAALEKAIDKTLFRDPQAAKAEEEALGGGR